MSVALVLLLHGGGQTRHAWKGTGEALAEAGFRAFSLDARGHGDWIGRLMAIMTGRYGDDLAAVVGSMIPTDSGWCFDGWWCQPVFDW